MKKIATIIICAIIAYMGVYTVSFADANFTQLSTIFNFILCGGIATLFLNMVLNVVNPKSSTAKKQR